jgi:hypothetical protein
MVPAVAREEGRGAGGRGTGARLTQGSPRDVLGVPTFGQVNSPGGRL